MSADTEALIQTVRGYIEGHQQIIDGPDETFTRELAPSARNPLAALDSLAAELERLLSIERELELPLGEMPALVGTDLVLVIQDQRDEALAEIDRVKAERDNLRRVHIEDTGRWMDAGKRLDKALAALRDVDAAFGWVAENYPKAIREMPRELYQPLRRIAEIEGEA